MNRQKQIAAIATALLLASCATESANMHIGGETPYTSLADQRAAMDVRIVADVPPGARIIGVVDASRCHRNMLDKPPSAEDVENDLRVAAYARGADGIAGVHVETRVLGSLLKNCWHTLVATGTAYRTH